MKLPADVRAYAKMELGWSETTVNAVEAEFFLSRTMNWSHHGREACMRGVRRADHDGRPARPRMDLLQM